MGRLEEALSHHQQALRLDPNSIDALYSQAGVLGALGRLDEAIALSDRALAIDPAFAPAIMRRATLLALQDRHAEAVLSFDQVLALPVPRRGAVCQGPCPARRFAAPARPPHRKPSPPTTAPSRSAPNSPTPGSAAASLCATWAISTTRSTISTPRWRVNPRHIDARLSRSALLATLGRNEESEREARQILAVDPANGAAFNNLGNALQRLGRMPEALASFEAAIRLVGNPNAARFNYGMCLLQAGEFTRGWREYEFRGRTEGWQVGWDLTCVPAWLGEADIAGRTILLYAEQGLGDTIQFCRYVPMVAALGARVLLGVPPALTGLMGSLSAAVEVIDVDQPAPAFDVHCSIMSLPLVFKTELETVPARVPYLAAPQTHRAKWRQILGPRRGPRIGLGWSGQ